MRVIFLATLVSAALAASKCYTGSAVATDDCSTIVTDANKGDCAGDFGCARVTGETIGIKSCGLSCNAAAMTDGCNTVEAGAFGINTKMTTCYCTGEYCNPASTVTGIAAIVVALIAALL
jgi:hypothetical protein